MWQEPYCFLPFARARMGDYEMIDFVVSSHAAPTYRVHVDKNQGFGHGEMSQVYHTEYYHNTWIVLLVYKNMRVTFIS